jgi:transcriptional regulator with XRE-family HTH domain
MKALKILRERKGVLKYHLAKFLGMDASNYKRLEEKNRSIGFDKLEQIRKYLNYSTQEFYSELERIDGDPQK